MKYRLVFMLGWLTLGLAFSPLSAQVVSPTLPGDTLPAITMRFEPLFLVPIVVAPAVALFLGGHSYQIKGEKLFRASAVKPYFEASRDPLLTDLYARHKRNRIIWYSTTAAGSAVVYVGFMQLLVAVVTLNPGALRSVNPYLAWGGALGAAGIAARIVCFRQLRKAVNYYNFKHAGPNPDVKLGLGLPSATPAGLGLYLKF